MKLGEPVVRGSGGGDPKAEFRQPPGDHRQISPVGFDHEHARRLAGDSIRTVKLFPHGDKAMREWLTRR